MNSYTEILNQVPEDYYERGVRTNPFQWLWHSWKFRNLKRFLVGLEGNILDVGCADRSLTAKMAKYLNNAKFTGVDLHEKSIKFARVSGRTCNSRWPMQESCRLKTVPLTSLYVLKH